MPTRRTFCLATAASLLSQLPLPLLSPLLAQTRLNLAQIDHDRILASAAKALARPVSHAPNSAKDPASDAFLDLTLDLPALAAANFIAEDPKYLAQARKHLEAWFITPDTRLPTELPDPETTLLYAPLAEVAVALPFLQLPAEDLARLMPWFSETLTWLTESRTALLARDKKDHIASSWLLQVAAFAHFTTSETALTEASHRFKTSTIRAQINRDGFFPNELPTPNPFRNSLLNLDLLAGACVLLSTRFDSLWDHELQDGPGMRAAIARHASFISTPSTWPYPSDRTHFHDLPGRRPALLFAARAYSQADYAAIWRTLNPDPTSPEILRAFPIRQPILWQSQPPFPRPESR